MKKQAKKIAVLLLALSLLCTVLFGCAQETATSSGTEEPSPSQSESSDSGEEQSDVGDTTYGRPITLLTHWQEDNGAGQAILAIADEYKADHPDFSLEWEKVEQNDLLQRIKVLLASQALPDLFTYQPAAPLVELIDADVLVNWGEVLKENDLMKYLADSSEEMMNVQVSGKGMYGLPTEMNFEGMWYNTQIFEENDIEIPKTFDELDAVAAKLYDAGIQPFAVAGKESWPITRYMNMYVVRKMGLDAMRQACQGEIDFNQPGFVEAAEWTKGLIDKGYFGESCVTLDYNAAEEMFLTGRTAMYYSGTWAVRAFNDPEACKINIGFFNIPMLEGTESTEMDFCVGSGLAFCASKTSFDEHVLDFMKYYISRFGNYSMEVQGQMTGYKFDMPENPTYITELMLNTFNSIENSTFWWEAYMDQEVTEGTYQDVQSLAIGDISGEEYIVRLSELTKASLE